MSNISAYTGIVREHHASLRYFIRSLGVHSAWVDDLAQEAFLVAFRKWHELDEPENAGIWLRSIARNLVMNEIKKNNRRQRLIDENLTSLLLDLENDDPEPGAHDERELRTRALAECLQGLTDRTQKIIRARYFDERNSSEIAEDLKIRPSTVRKILFDSRQVLADCLHSKSIHAAI